MVNHSCSGALHHGGCTGSYVATVCMAPRHTENNLSIGDKQEELFDNMTTKVDDLAAWTRRHSFMIQDGTLGVS